MGFMMNNKEAGSDTKADDTTQSTEKTADSALDIDSFFKKYDHLPGDEKPFYQDFANMVSASATKGQAEVQSQLQRVTTQSDMLLDMTWYNEAARWLNAYTREFFGSFFCRKAGVTKTDYFEASEQAKTEVPNVKF